MIADHQDDELFTVVRAGEIAAEPVSDSWLIESLWTRSAVGMIGGLPKSLKSWIALELATSVASATPCLGRYRVEDSGSALVYLAEDSLAAVRERLGALCHARGIALETLDIHVITASSMRLDLARDQVRLLKTARAFSPRLLVLDPLVRIHRLDENSSAEVSGFLSYLRELQRELDLSVVLVHHARKNSSAQAPGQSLRGSGDFHAWIDSGLYLRRRGETVVLSAEHRSAPSPEPITLRLKTSDSGPPCLQLIDGLEAGQERQQNLEERVVNALRESTVALTRSELRETLSVKNERLGRALRRLAECERIERGVGGWQLSGSTVPPSEGRSRREPLGSRGNGTIDDGEQRRRDDR